MKRSEMIELLHQYTSSLPKDYTDQTRDEAILDLLESNGMVPPAVKEPCPTYFQNTQGQVQRGEDSTVFVHKWEPEDEQCN